MPKKIKRGQKVEVSFSPRERVLVLEHTLTGPELTTALSRAQLETGKYMVRYTLDDLDELLGFVAAEANHSTDRKLRKELDALYARVRRQMSYDDGCGNRLSSPAVDRTAGSHSLAAAGHRERSADKT